MGNNQCVSQRSSNNNLWSKIENDLHNKNTTREKKILNEFKNLKRMMTEKHDKSNRSIKNANTISNTNEKIQKTQSKSLKELDENVESNPSLILIKSDCNLKIRMKRFIKWYKIAFKSRDDEISRKNKNVFSKGSDMFSPFKKINSDVNSPYFKNSENNQFDDLNSFNMNLSNFEINERQFESPLKKKKETQLPSNDNFYFLNREKGKEIRYDYDNNEILIKSQLNFRTSLNENIRENETKFQFQDNFDKDSKDSIIESIKDLQVFSRKDSNLESLRESNKDFNPPSFKFTDDLIEYNLKKFYIRQKYKFLERVSKGPPDSFRWLSWQICARINLPAEISQNLLEQYFSKPLDEETEIQIRKDLPRTLGEDFCFDHPETEILLYKILRAFANLDQEVKYCQGMNFIVRFLLLISDFNEHETFLMMIFIFSNQSIFNKNIKLNDTENTSNLFTGIRGFFLNNFILLKFYIYVFNYYFEKKMPNLFNHLNKMELPIEVWILKWFQTLYAIYLPTSCVARLWDCLLSMGLDFIIDFTLAILKSKESKILKINEAFDLVDFFKNEFNNKDMDIEEIIKIAKNIIKSKTKIIVVLKEEYEEIYKIKLDQFNIKYDLNITCNNEKMSSNFFNSSSAVSEERENVNSKRINDRKNSYFPSLGMNQSMNSFIKDFKKEDNWENENKITNKPCDLGTLSNFLITTKSNTGTAINKSNTIITTNNNPPRSPGTFTELEKIFTFTHISSGEVNENNLNIINYFSVDKGNENESEIPNNDSVCREFSGDCEFSNNTIRNITNNIFNHTIYLEKDVGIARYSECKYPDFEHQ